MFKILIAEDDRELRQLFSHVLAKNGYGVVGVSNGKEALKEIEAGYFDLIISDIMMPVMDGYELVRTLRDADNHTPVLMITAKDAFDAMQLGFMSGTDDYMVKPINVNEMILRVGALLRRAQLISERRLTIGETTMECDSLTVTTSGERMILPQKEFMLLFKMASFPGMQHPDPAEGTGVRSLPTAFRGEGCGIQLYPVPLFTGGAAYNPGGKLRQIAVFVI